MTEIINPAVSGERNSAGYINCTESKDTTKAPRVKPGTNNKDELRQSVIHRLVKKGGLRAKIDAKCCECIYDPYAEGTWRKQVENCTSFTCPLYEVRPKSEYREVAA